MLKIILRLLAGMTLFATSYVFYSNFTFSSLENIKNKKNISVRLQNLPEMLLPNKENITGYQYELLNEYLKTVGNNRLMLEDNPYDIDVFYATHTCPSCQVISKEDLLLITNENSGASNDVDIVRSFENIELGYPFLKTFEISYSDSSIDELINNIKNNLVTNAIVTRSTYLFYKKYFPSLRIKKVLGKVNLVWNFPNDDGSIRDNVKYFLESKTSKEFISMLKEKYYSKNSISSYIFIGSRAFISDMLTNLPRYESLFKNASDKFELDWKLLASISYQESKWDNDAVSPTGVKGLMMLTIGTAKMLNVDRLIPSESIFGGAQYFSELLKKYAKYNDVTKINLALAAYNAGPNHINDIILLADKNGENIDDWNTLKSYLYKLNQKKYYKKMKYGYARGWEAVQYIENVKQYYDILTFLDDKDKINSNQIFNEVPSTL